MAFACLWYGAAIGGGMPCEGVGGAYGDATGCEGATGVPRRGVGALPKPSGMSFHGDMFFAAEGGCTDGDWLYCLGGGANTFGVG